MTVRICEFCDDSFADESIYKAHLQFTHHYCEVCEECYENADALYFHLNSIDIDGHLELEE